VYGETKDARQRSTYRICSETTTPTLGIAQMFDGLDTHAGALRSRATMREGATYSRPIVR
jgi:hypothetical protein